MVDENTQHSSQWSGLSLDEIVPIMLSDVRQYITSVKTWAQLISALPIVSSIDLLNGRTLGDGMHDLLCQTEGILEELRSISAYVEAQRDRKGNSSD